jgi:hypothetical protein
MDYGGCWSERWQGCLACALCPSLLLPFLPWWLGDEGGVSMSGGQTPFLRVAPLLV